MSWVEAWLPTGAETTYRLEVTLAVLLAVSIFLSGIFGYLLWEVSTHRGKLEKQAAEKQLDVTRGELADARRRADEAATKATELEARQRPRVLTNEQRDVLITRLKPGHGSRFTASVPIGDAEAIEYGDQVIRAVMDAGWKFEGGGQAVGFIARGVFVVVSDREDVPETAKILAQALNAAGIEAKLTRESSVPAGQPIGLWIGRNP